jgi:hypothetical protein
VTFAPVWHSRPRLCAVVCGTADLGCALRVLLFNHPISHVACFF